MAKKREQLQVLLLQIRDDDITLAEEFAEFVHFSGLEPSQIHQLDAFRTPEFTPQIIDNYDALFVGGSSDASVLYPEKYPFDAPAKLLIQHCYEQNIPVFASSFGFQIAVEQLGGKVILDRDNMEVGFFPIKLLPAAAEDILLHDCPEEFWSVSGHQERAKYLPTDAIALAQSDTCPYHIFKMKDKPFYGFQFHPEVDRHDLIARITRYQDRYLDSDGELQKLISSAIHDTPHANNLLLKFVDRILCS